MNKAQAIQAFWSSFGLEAYDENTVPDKIPDKYITYSVATDSLDRVVNLTASIWERNTNSWAFVEETADEIARVLEQRDFSNLGTAAPSIPIDNGRVFLTKGSPFAQRLADPGSDLTRRIYLNVQAEFLTET